MHKIFKDSSGFIPTIIIVIVAALGLFLSLLVFNKSSAVDTITITTSSLPEATENALYQAFLKASGGTAPLNWSVSSGSLPSGLTLNSSTGVISGTPTLKDRYKVTFQVTDLASPPQSIAKAFSLMVKSPTGANCNNIFVGFTPLNDLGAGTYQGYPGGLYPGGTNTRPTAYESAGVSLANNIVPLDANGNYDPVNGKIVLLSIGMSNTALEFAAFKPIADADALKNSKLVIVNGAQGGQTASLIANPNSNFWSEVVNRLTAAGVTTNQVAVTWVKEANSGPTGTFPVPEQTLRDNLAAIARILKSKYPNIKIAYYSSRVYGGYATGPTNPEPYAYGSGFSVKWLIEGQINNDPQINVNYDPTAGPVVAPWLAWGPYMWADGLNPRSDDLVWSCQEFVTDGTHLNGAGTTKVANMLLNFFKTDSTAKPWFRNDQNPQPTPTPGGPTPTPTPTAIATPTPTSGRGTPTPGGPTPTATSGPRGT